MHEPASAPSLDCPFLRPVTVDYLWMYPTSVYCGLRPGRVRVPCQDTVTRICTNGSYRNCPNYRGWGQAETTPEAS